ncbi:MAG: glycosyltransferase family 2 protein [Halieaceae bacterium]|jgi:glycosyltransferase involved in cell wall biosynthesis|nr:glycosyltransferase family 2 protein [Halieaceae bacterium]
MSSLSVSIIIPAKNEAEGLAGFLPELRTAYPEAELIVVNDGSTDDTAAVAEQAGARVESHPYSKGNGAAIKSGARAANGEVLLFMDGDGQHQVRDVARLLLKIEEGFDLVVGARQGGEGQASLARWGANSIYNMFASWMVGHDIPDLTSGMRAVRRDKFLSFLYLLPNGFSYPTTSTMAFYRAGYSVAFVPIECLQRVGKSHIKLWRDGTRFLLIIFKIGTLYSPLKLFFPISAGIFLAGLSYYAYTYFSMGRFTNMSLLLFVSSVIVFLIGLISEQISNLTYKIEQQR